MSTTTINGQTYHLDRIPDAPLTFASLPRLRANYQVGSANWVENDQLEAFNPPVLNQIQNGCVGHGGSTAFTLAYSQSGQEPPDGGFSPTWLYALINGGRDQGAMIGDLVGAMKTVGVCTAKTFPESKYMLGGAAEKLARPEAANYLAHDVYAFDSWEELATALSMGFAVAHSVMVGRSFPNLDKNGVVGVDAGPGNHCVAAGGLRLFGGAWQAHGQNSWGTGFSPDGRFYSGEAHVNSQRYYSGVAIKSVVRKQPAPAA